MTWEQHRFAVERARDRLRKAAEIDEQGMQMATLQNVAAREDENMLDDVADFLETLDRKPVPGTALMPPVERQREFIAQWNSLISRVGTFAKIWSLPPPEMLFSEKWFDLLRWSSPDYNIRATLIYMDVKVRFGQIQQADVFRTL